MQDEKALLQAIRAEPDNEELRLIAADWFEERGDPRGEFIRVQCALERLLSPQHPTYAVLKARERELLAANVRRWNGPLHRQLADTPLRGQVKGRRALVQGWTYRRGFVEVLRVEARAFLEQAEVLFQLGPVRHVRLRRAGGVIQQVAQCPSLDRLRTLDLCGNGIGDEGVRALATSSNLARLTTLNLRANGITSDGARALAGTRSLANLAALELSYNNIHADGFRQFVVSPHLPQLNAVHVDGNPGTFGLPGHQLFVHHATSW
jgi:uncharacterized protein (TIGR02996 family)